ncbi:hypothetical protein [Streptomyces sp. HUAS TT7]|uniref:hypothetical protein n=1 Tax=Streptomyces sp. HUAS TT7 TaxID=3447507 RepID=UPI003F65BBB1
MLGPLPAQITGREVRLDRPRQAKMSAALLVDANNVVAMERLIAVMWDGNAPAPRFAGCRTLSPGCAATSPLANHPPP